MVPLTPDPRHLSAVRRLVDEFEPVLVSEHAVWSSANGIWFADLLPLPRTADALRQLVEGVDRYQEAIGRHILIENPTNYLPFVSEMDEPAFLNEVALRTGCGLLLDVNNVYLSARNCGIDPEWYVRSLPADRIEEIHIAGFEADENLGESLLIDTHAAPVSEAVWNLLDVALAHFGPRPVLLERDGKLPPFETLMEERRLAAAALSRHRDEFGASHCLRRSPTHSPATCAPARSEPLSDFCAKGRRPLPATASTATDFSEPASRRCGQTIRLSIISQARHASRRWPGPYVEAYALPRTASLVEYGKGFAPLHPGGPRDAWPRLSCVVRCARPRLDRSPLFRRRSPRSRSARRHFGRRRGTHESCAAGSRLGCAWYWWTTACSTCGARIRRGVFGQRVEIRPVNRNEC